MGKGEHLGRGVSRALPIVAGADKRVRSLKVVSKDTGIAKEETERRKMYSRC